MCERTTLYRAFLHSKFTWDVFIVELKWHEIGSKVFLSMLYAQFYGCKGTIGRAEKNTRERHSYSDFAPVVHASNELAHEPTTDLRDAFNPEYSERCTHFPESFWRIL